MNWGKWIIVVFVFFVVFIGSMITIMMKQDIGLVSRKYYADDLAYEQQYKRKMNTETLDRKPQIDYKENLITINFFDTRVSEGEVLVFRPSSEELDQRFEINSSGNAVHIFHSRPLQRGPYRIKLTWTMNGTEYYWEHILIVQ